jgi:hypothetical protein
MLPAATNHGRYSPPPLQPTAAATAIAIAGTTTAAAATEARTAPFDTLGRIFSHTSRLATPWTCLAPHGSICHLATGSYQYSKPTRIQTRTSQQALEPRTPATTGINSPAEVFTRTSDLHTLSRYSHPADTIIRSLPNIITRTLDLATPNSQLGHRRHYYPYPCNINRSGAAANHPAVIAIRTSAPRPVAARPWG